LQQVWDTQSDESYGYLMYNDEIPKGGANSGSFGHTKGVVSFTADGGYWLVHSLPNFPDAPKDSKTFNVPESYQYGQSYFCMSLDAANMNTVGLQLQINNPQVYGSQFSAQSVSSAMPHLAALVGLTKDSSLTYAGGIGSFRSDAKTNVAELTTRFKHLSLTSFAKNTKWNDELYSALVAPTLKTPIMVESWMRPYEGNIKGKFETDNVATVTLGPYSWGETNDHSKWVVSQDGSAPWICIGDINKQKSQYKRAGGTVCMHDANVWKAFHAIATVDSGKSGKVDAMESEEELVHEEAHHEEDLEELVAKPHHHRRAHKAQVSVNVHVQA